jgi:transcription antitermination factor NusG
VEVDKRFSIAWFAVQVQPKHESITAAHLQYKGYESYVPLYVLQHEQKHGRAGNRPRPVFPGYVFCRFCLGDGAAIGSGGGIVTTARVVCIIGAGRTPVPIPNEEIEAIQRVLGLGLPAGPVPYLRVGQKV